MPRSSRAGAALAAVLAAAGLLGTCSDDDATSPTTEAEASAGVCDRLEPVELRRATGRYFDDAVPDGTTCTYSSSESTAVVGLSVTSLGDVPAEDALALLRESCEPDTAVDLAVTTAEAAFGCTVQGAATVAAAGSDHLAVLAGVTLAAPAPERSQLDALGRLVERALRAPA